jgi:hypothetical protein
VKSSTSVTLHQIFLGWSNPEGWPEQTCSTYEEVEECIQNFSRENLKIYFGDLVANGRGNIKIYRKEILRGRFNWLKIGFSDRIL